MMVATLHSDLPLIDDPEAESPGTRIDVELDDPRWHRRKDYPDIAAAIDRSARATLAAATAPERGWTVCVLLTGDARQSALNSQFRNKEKSTNVLSFPQWDDPPAGSITDDLPLGDISLAYETVSAEADESGRRIADHVAHLIVHAMLHLLGWDHQSDEDAAAMEALETAILAELNIADPYAAEDLTETRQ